MCPMVMVQTPKYLQPLHRVFLSVRNKSGTIFVIYHSLVVVRALGRSVLLPPIVDCFEKEKELAEDA
jgi:hypothetical protein